MDPAEYLKKYADRLDYVGSGKFLSLVAGQAGEAAVRDQGSDVVHRFQDALLVGGVQQIVEDGARGNGKAVSLHFFP